MSSEALAGCSLLPSLRAELRAFGPSLWFRADCRLIRVSLEHVASKAFEPGAL